MRKFLIQILFSVFLLIFTLLLMFASPALAGFKLPGTYEVEEEKAYRPMPFYYVHRTNRITTSRLPDIPPVPSNSLTPFSHSINDLPFEPPILLYGSPHTIRDRRKLWSPFFNPARAFVPAWSR